MNADVNNVLTALASEIGQLKLELAVARDIIRQHEEAATSTEAAE